MFYTLNHYFFMNVFTLYTNEEKYYVYGLKNPQLID